MLPPTQQAGSSHLVRCLGLHVDGHHECVNLSASDYYRYRATCGLLSKDETERRMTTLLADDIDNVGRLMHAVSWCAIERNKLKRNKLKRLVQIHAR